MMAETIRALFSTDRPIDRAIEKVIDYYAQAEGRLAAEIEEYEVTDNVEASFRKFTGCRRLALTKTLNQKDSHYPGCGTGR